MEKTREPEVVLSGEGWLERSIAPSPRDLLQNPGSLGISPESAQGRPPVCTRVGRGHDWSRLPLSPPLPTAVRAAQPPAQWRREEPGGRGRGGRCAGLGCAESASRESESECALLGATGSLCEA